MVQFLWRLVFLFGTLLLVLYNVGALEMLRQSAHLEMQPRRLMATSRLNSVRDVHCTGASSGDAEMLQEVIDRSVVGDKIQIHGNCSIDRTICLLGHRFYVGDSRTGTIIRQAAHANMPALLASDSWCENRPWTGSPIQLAAMTLDGNRAHNNGTVGLMLRSWQSTVEDIFVTNTPSDGIRLTNLARDNVTGLRSSQVNGRISNVFVSGTGGSGIRVLDTQNSVTDWSLLDSWVAASGESAVLLDNAAGWQVRGVHTYMTAHHAIYAKRCFATALEGNYIEDMGLAGGFNTTFYGVACHAQKGAASLISDNKVFGFHADLEANSSFVYIGISGVAGGSDSEPAVVGVHGNVVRGVNRSGDVGLSYQAGSGVLEVSSTANHVHGVRVQRMIGPHVELAKTF